SVGSAAATPVSRTYTRTAASPMPKPSTPATSPNAALAAAFASVRSTRAAYGRGSLDGRGEALEHRRDRAAERDPRAAREQQRHRMKTDRVDDQRTRVASCAEVSADTGDAELVLVARLLRVVVDGDVGRKIHHDAHRVRSRPAVLAHRHVQLADRG